MRLFIKYQNFSFRGWNLLRSFEQLLRLGHARDYVDAQWIIFQHDEPDDFVISPGEQHFVRELFELAFNEVGVEIELRYFCSTEVDELLGNPAKAKKELDWQSKTTFIDFIKDMIKEDLTVARRDQFCFESGFTIRGNYELSESIGHFPIFPIRPW